MDERTIFVAALDISDPKERSAYVEHACGSDSQLRDRVKALGASVDDELGTLQNAAANADDVDSALPDDEDGLNNPVADLTLTIRAQPTVNVIVTNTTGSTATLSGWIDYDNNGLFDNATERAQATILSGATDEITTLTFPTLPEGFTDTTYARFRLSTDSAADDPTGVAADGEVEDYVVTINGQSNGLPSGTVKIASDTNGGPTLADADQFGGAVCSLGDLNGDGVPDLAVGAPGDGIVGDGSGGAVHVLFMNSNGTVDSSQKIANGIGGGPTLADHDLFGSSICTLGDLDADGVTDLAVGIWGDDDYDSSPCEKSIQATIWELTVHQVKVETAFSAR